MIKLKIKKGDTVKVIAGDSKGDSGIVRSVDVKKNRVIIEGVNMVKRHTKPSAAHPDGGIIEKEAALHISNVAIMDGEIISRVGRRVESGKVVRYIKKTDKTIN